MKSIDVKAVEAAKTFEYSHQLETANPKKLLKNKRYKTK